MLRELRTGKQLTDLEELECMLAESGEFEASDPDAGLEASRGLGRFIRSIVGLEGSVARGRSRASGICSPTPRSTSSRPC